MAALPLLKKGDTGFGVMRLQNALNNAGYKAGPPGVFDDLTERVLREFQMIWKVPVTGQSDAATWTALAKFDVAKYVPAGDSGGAGLGSPFVWAIALGLPALWLLIRWRRKSKILGGILGGFSGLPRRRRFKQKRLTAA